eukprot:3993799-Amphidinium_carterae.1
MACGQVPVASTILRNVAKSALTRQWQFQEGALALLCSNDRLPELFQGGNVGLWSADLQSPRRIAKWPWQEKWCSL